MGVIESIQRAAAEIRSADALLIGAGAGMGVDSGLPDFRGNEGFWKAYPPFGKLGLSFTDLAQPRWFHSDPAQAWGFYGHRRNLYRRTAPHAGFEILRRWTERMAAGSFVFTSNVDSHFQKTGFSESRIIECHGSLEHLQCVQRCMGEIWPAGGEPIDVDESTFRAREPLPLCPRCSGLTRPNVLMFNDYEWHPNRTEEQLQRYQEWLAGIDGRRLVVIELGAGLAVPSVRHECQRQGGTLIRINVREAQVPRGGIGIAMGALAALEQLDRLV